MLYMDTNKRRPSHSSKNKDIRVLGKWVRNQMQTYEKQQFIMKDENIRKTWEAFKTNPSYSKYFK